jgi:hypothetical protein
MAVKNPIVEHFQGVGGAQGLCTIEGPLYDPSDLICIQNIGVTNQNHKVGNMLWGLRWGSSNYYVEYVDVHQLPDVHNLKPQLWYTSQYRLIFYFDSLTEDDLVDVYVYGYRTTWTD